MNVSFLQELLGSIAERGRALIDRSATRPGGKGGPRLPETLESLGRGLLSGRGEASGVALARQLLDLYDRSPMPARVEFFHLLARSFDPDLTQIRAAWEAYQQDASPAHLQDLLEAVEPPRQELFRRLNLAPGGTAALVAMREDLIKHGGKDDQLRKVDDDFAPSVLAPGSTAASWSCAISTGPRPADILEQIIRYEAVHEIQGWDELRRRVQPDRPPLLRLLPPLADRRAAHFRRGGADPRVPAPRSSRCWPRSARCCRPARRRPPCSTRSSNCQQGLRGVSFGNFLIKQVVEDLTRELPSLDLRHALAGARLRPLAAPRAGRAAAGRPRRPEPQALAALARRAGTPSPPGRARQAGPAAPGCRLLPGEPRSPAASRSTRWRGSTSATAPGSSASTGWATRRPKALREAHGLMVNYLYDLR